MKRLSKITLVFVTMAFLMGLVVSAFSQEVGGGPNSAFYLNRANQARNPGGAQQPPPGISPADYARFQAGTQALPGQAQPNQPAPPPVEVKMIPVVEGELVISAKSNQVLQKPEKKMVPETLKDNYYDDGTHGDETPNDGTYSNVVVRKDVISKDEFKTRLMLETLINKISRDNPVEFYRLYVAADSHNPEIPSYSYWRSRRDEFINDYKARVLAPYKDANGNFYEVYEPPKVSVPQLPNLPGQQSAGQQPQNVGVAKAVQGRINQAGADEAGINQVGGSSYLGERNGMR